MEEQNFEEKIRNLNNNFDGLVLETPVYYSIDDDGNVMVDFDSIREEFENKLNEISDFEKPENNAEEEFNELLKTGEIKIRKDGFGQFQGYDDEAGHIYKNKKEVIDKWGLGE